MASSTGAAPSHPQAQVVPPPVLPSLDNQYTKNPAGSGVDVSASTSIRLTTVGSNADFVSEPPGRNDLFNRVCAILYFIAMHVSIEGLSYFGSTLVNPPRYNVDLNRVANKIQTLQTAVFGSSMMQAYLFLCFIEWDSRHPGKTIYDIVELKTFRDEIMVYFTEKALLTMWGPLGNTVNIPEIWARGADAPVDNKFGALLSHCKHVFLMYAYAVARGTNVSKRPVSASDQFPKVGALKIHDMAMVALNNYNLPKPEDVPLVKDFFTFQV